MARTGETCGAVTGAMMVIGLRHAKVRPDDDASRELAYALAQEFMDAFRQRNRFLLCRELLGVDVSTPEGMKEVREKDLFATVCPEFVRDAAEIVEELLFTGEPERGHSQGDAEAAAPHGTAGG